MLAKWLNARYYSTKYVPVPIKEYLVHDGTVYPVSTASAFFRTASQISSTQPWSEITPVRQVEMSTFQELRSPLINAVVALAVETATAGKGALVFCGGRQICQNTATLISRAMLHLNVGEDMSARRKDLINELRSLPTGLDATLGDILLSGVAFHREQLTSCLQKDSTDLSTERCWSHGRRTGFDGTSVRQWYNQSHCGDLQSSGRHQSSSAKSHLARCKDGQGPHWPSAAVRVTLRCRLF